MDLGPGLDPSLAKDLDRSLAGSFAPVLAKTLAESEDEDELEALASCNLKDLAAAEPAGLRVGKPVKIPSPGPPSWMGCTSVTSCVPECLQICGQQKWLLSRAACRYVA